MPRLWIWEGRMCRIALGALFRPTSQSPFWGRHHTSKVFLSEGCSYTSWIFSWVECNRRWIVQSNRLRRTQGEPLSSVIKIYNQNNIHITLRSPKLIHGTLRIVNLKNKFEWSGYRLWDSICHFFQFFYRYCIHFRRKLIRLCYQYYYDVLFKLSRNCGPLSSRTLPLYQSQSKYQSSRRDSNPELANLHQPKSRHQSSRRQLIP